MDDPMNDALKAPDTDLIGDPIHNPWNAPNPAGRVGGVADVVGGDVNTGAESHPARSAFSLTSAAFADGGTIPVQYTCDGAGHSPPLAWNRAPEETRGFALIVHDPDAPKGDFTHWLLFDIPGMTSGIAEGAEAEGIPGTNDFGKVGYGGPCPPPGDGPHRYLFTLYALNKNTLGLGRGANRADVEAALTGHVLDRTTLQTSYKRTAP
jgi:Raf kinase inhibitor-like YbhB/YbcL family protein